MIPLHFGLLRVTHRFRFLFFENKIWGIYFPFYFTFFHKYSQFSTFAFFCSLYVYTENMRSSPLFSLQNAVIFVLKVQNRGRRCILGGKRTIVRGGVISNRKLTSLLEMGPISFILNSNCNVITKRGALGSSFRNVVIIHPINKNVI